ncbi:polysaccharide deacetylase family protein [Deminuibacter soli]|nr:polysaccharide deacetylase family protein [Deminuibacter soli]
MLLTGCSNSPQTKRHSAGGDTPGVEKGAADTVPKAVMPKKDSSHQFAWDSTSYDTSKCYIYLTFDDGPQNGTMNCYHIVKDLGIKATFFMVGMHADDRALRNIVDSIRDGYPEILLANHSFTHANNKYHYFYDHPEMAMEDFLKAQESLQVPFKIIRLPGNSAWVREGEVRASKLVKPVTLLLDSLQYNVIGWDVEWNFNHKTARPVQSVTSMLKLVEEAMNRGESHTKKHVVILSHDRMFRHPEDADSLYNFINTLKQNPRYVFETITSYPKLKTPGSN